MFQKKTFGFLVSEVCKIRILAKNGLILEVRFFFCNPLSTNLIKWSYTLKQLSVFDHFVSLAIKGLSVMEVRIVLIRDARLRSGVFIVNFEHISHLFLIFLLLTLSM